MALLKIALVFALACASLGEPIFRKGNQNGTIFTSNTITNVYWGEKKELVKVSQLNITVKRDGPPGPPPRASDAAQIYQLVNEQIAPMQVMSHNTDGQAPQSYANLPLLIKVNGYISMQSGRPHDQTNTDIKFSKADYGKNQTLH